MDQYPVSVPIPPNLHQLMDSNGYDRVSFLCYTCADEYCWPWGDHDGYCGPCWLKTNTHSARKKLRKIAKPKPRMECLEQHIILCMAGSTARRYLDKIRYLGLIRMVMLGRMRSSYLRPNLFTNVFYRWYDILYKILSNHKQDIHEELKIQGWKLLQRWDNAIPLAGELPHSSSNE